MAKAQKDRRFQIIKIVQEFRFSKKSPEPTDVRKADAVAADPLAVAPSHNYLFLHPFVFGQLLPVNVGQQNAGIQIEKIIG